MPIVTGDDHRASKHDFPEGLPEIYVGPEAAAPYEIDAVTEAIANALPVEKPKALLWPLESDLEVREK